MRLNRRASALASWMAMLVMLLAILAPALSHAFAGDATAAYLSADICRAGSASAAADGMAAGDAAAPDSHEGTFKHCPYCHHGNGMLLLPPAPSALALAVADAPPAAQRPDAPKARSARTPAQARGPPLA